MGKIEIMDRKNELKDVMEIWLSSNIDAHDFIDKNYWKDNYKMVEEILPEADIRVYKEDGKILGFMGISDNYIAGIFVDRKYRSKGIGYKLLEDAKSRYEILNLDVYEKNIGAVKFYKKNDFKEVSRELEEKNNEIELHMEWQR